MIIEQLIQTYLSKLLDVPVVLERPEKPPAQYVLIEKLGGGEDNHIFRATIAVQSYAKSLFEASVLNEIVKQAMNGLVLLDEICRSKLNSDYNHTDPTSKQYRYQAVYDITHY